ncbi:molecular chaperone GrpE [Austwickia chelonae]|uniref:Protein GrpE n=1 Tax=Austwickia chelonae NBRC 105200 TaxID=1184607 RepID=K6V9L5_9MICO|nr:nucleotide exchange factor GrpE [Austwickia chelonae]GAB78923.1 GrpE protein [Austwickia chelonae NBRC 105200]SEV86641.1 molecular chaperone GrpE [Austwickia chelonae]
MTDKDTRPTDGSDAFESAGGDPTQGRVGDSWPGQGPSAAQQAAARGMYEDMQASTGGDSRTTVDAEPVVDADEPLPVEDEIEAVDGENPDEGAPSEDEPQLDEPAGISAPEAMSPDAQLAAERLNDLQRLQAEYVNYKRRVDRDRALESERAVAGMVESLLPVLDEIHLARQHGELEVGPFAKIAEKLEGILARYGVSRYGEMYDRFDPNVHEAVMHMQAELPEGTLDTTVVQVMQPGYRIGDRVVRPALVAVADPM